MKRVNEINERRNLKDEFAYEKLSHISDILEYKLGIKNICGVYEDQYNIYIEDEGEEICFKHTYKIKELLKCDVNSEVYRLRKDFCICIALEAFQEIEDEIP